MKRINYLVPLALCLLASSCQKDEVASTSDNFHFISVKASIEAPATRSSVTDAGVFSWTAGDNIGVWTTRTDGDPAFQALAYNTANGKFEGSLTGSGLKYSKYAVYPHSEQHSISDAALTVTLPDTYDYTDQAYSPNVNALMVANIGDESSTLNDLRFYHAGGVVSVRVKNLPAGACGVRLTTNKDVTGTFNVTGPGTAAPGITAAEKSTKNAVTIKFDALSAASTEEMQFFFPLPVGEGYTFKLEYLTSDNAEPTLIKEGASPNTISRAGLLLMPTLTLTSVGASGENSGYGVVNIAGETTYVVYNAEGLLAVNELVQNDLDANITLDADIDLTNVEKKYDDKKSNWKSIGEYHANGLSKKYTGIFNGNNKTITGIVIESDENGQGLIGFLGENGIVRNLKLLNCSITSSGSYIGGIAGENHDGTIEDCTVENISINSTITGTAPQPCVGGIVGRNYYGATVSACKIYSSEIKSTGAIVGGIAGQNFHIVKDSEVLNKESSTFSVSGTNIIGGIVGNNHAGDHFDEAKVSNCHVISTALDKIKITGTGYNTGGLIGSSTRGIVENCSVTFCTVTGVGNQAGGLLGFNNGSVVSGCIVNNCVVTGNSRVGGIAGKNAYDIAQSRNATGIIISCLANNVNVISNLTATDTETPNGKSSVGGIVGINVSKNTTGEIIGCYAFNCTMGENKDALTDAANIVGFNSYKSESRYGTVIACHYRKSNDTGENVSSANADAVETPTVVTGIDWSAAVTSMNSAIDTWNDTNAYACKYKWATDKTYSTAELADINTL